ncbi:AMP-binding protein [Methylogaea oryzae]|uniref:AMP-binding protein n=1 Tax=Methylogaea oryzae TaxID=1295382 RepID=UPI001FEA4A3C|nr:AMP-binding protein [Methylogaea oryzae]
MWSDVRELARRLPERPSMFNLCENRYLFCVSLLAAAWRGQACLLPPSSQAAVLREIADDYPGAYVAAEREAQAAGLPWFEVAATQSGAAAPEPDYDWRHPAVIAFTSGSGGRPKPCVHSLGTFRTSALMALSSLGLGQQPRLLLSTTPPQHMYGLETSVFWPLFSRLVLHDGKPFFPEDIRRIAANAPWPALLASTPTHLRALVKAPGSWDEIAGVISATDALPEQLAGQIKTALGRSPHEIYGSTETLSFANREPLRDSLWRPYAGARLIPDAAGQTRLESPHLPDPVWLQDDLRIEPDGRFNLLGRQQDMVKIGGKRASLAELNRRLKDIDGVEDGFCYLQETETGEGRLAAVVVGTADKQSVRQGLRPYVDEVFLPRRVHFAESLPRNAVGKLTKAELERFLANLA